MICPICKEFHYFYVLLNLSETDNSEQILTENDVVTCCHCKKSYTLGELAEYSRSKENGI